MRQTGELIVFKLRSRKPWGSGEAYQQLFNEQISNDRQASLKACPLLSIFPCSTDHKRTIGSVWIKPNMLLKVSCIFFLSSKIAAVEDPHQV